MNKARARASQLIDGGSLDFFVAVCAQVVGTKRINGDEDDVGAGVACRR